MSQERKDDAWADAAKLWLKADKAKDKAKRELLMLAGKKECHGFGVKRTLCPVSGKLKYELIPELRGVELDKYRGPGSIRSEIKAMKI